MAEAAQPASASASTRARLFFALWPDATVSGRLDAQGRQLRDECRGRLTRRETLHLTLAFLGDVDRQRIAELGAIAAQIDAPAFVLQLDVLGSWTRNRIAWAGCSETPGALQDLAAALAERLRAAGIELERRPFRAHITLLRKIASPFPARGIAPIAWRADEFVLVESVRTAEGARYQVIGRWPLRE